MKAPVRWQQLSLAGLVVLNLALLAILWLRPGLVIPPPGHETGIPDQDPVTVRRFLEDALKLSPDQRDRMVKLRSAHFRGSEPLRREAGRLRRQLMEEVLADSPRPQRVDDLAARLGERQAMLEKLTFYHILDLYRLCRPDQQPIFRGLLDDLLARMRPRRAGSPRGT